MRNSIKPSTTFDLSRFKSPFQGKGVVKRLEIKPGLVGEKVPGPATLVEHYPALGEYLAA